MKFENRDGRKNRIPSRSRGLRTGWPPSAAVSRIFAAAFAPTEKSSFRNLEGFYHNKRDGILTIPLENVEKRRFFLGMAAAFWLAGAPFSL
jgi:hypothetical protein